MRTLVKPEDGGDVRLFPSPWTPLEANRLMKDILSEVELETKRVRIHNKWFDTPRLQAAYADPGVGSYRFSGAEVVPREAWPPSLLSAKKAVEDLLAAHYSTHFPDMEGATPNYVLCNLYRDGTDHIGWHADDEGDLVKPLIVSVSLGATRDFVLRRNGCKDSITTPLTSGSILVMAGDTQKNYKHSVPRRARVDLPRLNLTFRFMRMKS